MATPIVNTLALVPPRRPTIEDFGGVAKKDDAKYPPNPVTMPTAPDWNEKVRMLAAAWRVIPVAIIPVTFPSPGTPTIGTPTCGNEELMPPATPFTATPNAPGDTTITWPANTFPASIIPPMAIITIDGSWAQPVALPVSNGVQVKTRTTAGVLNEADFFVAIF